MKPAVANRDTLVLSARSLSVLVEDYLLNQSDIRKSTTYRHNKNGERYLLLHFNVRQGWKIAKQVERLKNMIHRLEA